MSTTRRLITTVCLALLACGVAAQGAIRLPDFGDASGGVFTRADEARLGEAFLREILASRDALREPEVEAYVNAVGFKLVAASDDASLPFTFVVLGDPLINAFAGPTGVIGVNAGLLLAVRSESEFAAVLAHEIAHVTQRHLARSIELDDRSSIPTMAGVLAAIVLATQSAEAGQAAFAAVVGGRVQQQIDFIRRNELEADRLGIEILAEAGYDPRAMADFFEQLQSSQRYYRLPPEFLATHPVTTTRIAESRQRAEPFGYKQFADSDAFALAQAKLKVLTEPPAKVLAGFEADLAQGAGSNLDAKRYGRALALMALDRPAEAVPILRALREAKPGALGVTDALARALNATGKTDEAERLYRDGLNVYLFDRILTFGYARALLDAARHRDAVTLLGKYLERSPDDAPAHRLIAEAHDRLGQVAASHASLAESNYHTGRLQLAIQHLETAQRAEGTDYYLASRIDARLESLRAEHAARKPLDE